MMVGYGMGSVTKEIDSDIEMNICGATPKPFTPTEEDGSGLQLPSRSGDLQVDRVDKTGKMVRLPEPKRLKPGTSCGRVSIAGTMVAVEDLQEGVVPEVHILCENQRSPRQRLRWTVTTLTPLWIHESTTPRSQHPHCDSSRPQ